MTQTGVEWFFMTMNIRGLLPNDEIVECYNQAKAMEKEQIKDAFVECWKSNVPDGVECKLDAEQYYNETYESNT